MKSLTLAILLTITSARAGSQNYVQPRAYQQPTAYTFQAQPTLQPQLYTAPQTFPQQQVYIQPQPQIHQSYKPQQNFASQQNAHRSIASSYQNPTRQNQGNEADKNARIVKYEAENDGHNYMYSYETENGIRVQEAGTIQGKSKAAQGGYSYTSDDGQVYTVTYTADENGFRPQGAHLPTPPPMSEAIAKAVEQNLQDEANGVVDNGQYTEEQHQGGGENYQQQQHQQTQPKYRQQVPQQQFTYEQPPSTVQYVQQQRLYQYESQPQQQQYHVLQYQQQQQQQQQQQYDEQLDQQLVQVTPAPYQHQSLRVVSAPRLQQVYHVGATQDYA